MSYVKNICADGEECQPLPGTSKAPECYILRSVNELEDPMPIKHKWGYLAIACLTCSFAIIESAVGGYLWNITRYTATDNTAFITLLVGDGYVRGIGSWWASFVCAIAGVIAIAAVVQAKSQKGFVLAANIASGIGMVLAAVGVAVESYVYSYGTLISACTNPAGVNYGYNGDYTGATACMNTYSVSGSIPDACYCVSRNGNALGGFCAKVTQGANSPYTNSNCSLPISFNSRQLSSICFGALTSAITVCLFIYSIVILVEQPPVSLADDKGLAKSVNAPGPAPVVYEPPSIALKV